MKLIRGRRARRSMLFSVALTAVCSTVLSGCFFVVAEEHQRTSPNTRPWFCQAQGDGTPADHHGNGSHVDPAYAGKTKGDLSWDDCIALSHHFDRLLTLVGPWNTRAKAEKAGWGETAHYVSGIGTHHGMGSTFTGFDPDKPTFLDFGGSGPDAPLVGVSWAVFSNTVPAGLPGNNDWWHTHPTLCRNARTGAILGDAEEISDAECTRLGGTNLRLANLFVLHAWILPGLEHKYDVFASEHPCLGRTALLPKTDPCWNLTAVGAAGPGH